MLSWISLSMFRIADNVVKGRMEGLKFRNCRDKLIFRVRYHYNHYNAGCFVFLLRETRRNAFWQFSGIIWFVGPHLNTV